MEPTEPLSRRTPAEKGTAAVAGFLSGSEFQLSTEVLVPLKTMEFLATRPLENLEVLRRVTSIHFSIGAEAAPPRVMEARVTILGATEPL